MPVDDGPDHFVVTPRQRRLRVLTVVLLATILAMIAVGISHPFFRTVASPAVAARVREEIREQHQPGATRRPPSSMRRAVFLRLLFIYLYWMLCVLLTTSVLVLAWLDVREVRREMARLRLRLLREATERLRERAAGPPDA